MIKRDSFNHVQKVSQEFFAPTSSGIKLYDHRPMKPWARNIKRSWRRGGGWKFRDEEIAGGEPKLTFLARKRISNFEEQINVSITRHRLHHRYVIESLLGMAVSGYVYV
jgi:hypothetical protein